MNILELIKQYNIQLQTAGNLYKIACPFHGEKAASCFIYPDTNSFYCFGCGAGGDVIQFARLYNKVSYREALKFLNMKDQTFSLNKLKNRLQPTEKNPIEQYYLLANKILHKLKLSLSNEAIEIDRNFYEGNTKFLKNFIKNVRENQ